MIKEYTVYSEVDEYPKYVRAYDDGIQIVDFKFENGKALDNGLFILNALGYKKVDKTPWKAKDYSKRLKKKTKTKPKKKGAKKK